MQKVFEKIVEKLEEELNLADEEKLRSVRENHLQFDSAKGYANGVANAIEIVKQEAEKYNNGWIPCSERLPEDGMDVLVWFEYFRYGNYNRLFRTIGISYTYNGQWSGFVNGSSGWRDLTIFAWQPLPDPYQPTRKNCRNRHENGNCLAVGGFCTAVDDKYCKYQPNEERTKKTNFDRCCESVETMAQIIDIAEIRWTKEQIMKWLQSEAEEYHGNEK